MNPPVSRSKVALVTGASAGIGKAIVLRLLAEGWVVYGGARRTELMNDLLQAGAKVLPLDVTSEVSMAAAVATVLQAEGHLDALVNNAGYGSYGAIEDVPIEEARRQFEVNVFGLARLCQLVLPAMRTARSGTILNISSMGGRFWMPVGGWYHATKHALEVLSDTLRMEVAPFGIRVVVVQPGAIRSEWAEIAADHLDANSRHSVYRRLTEPMARLLRSYPAAAGPEVVARTVTKALSSRRPRRRYAVPLDARLAIFAKWVLPEFAWEALLRLVLR
jgi:NAD(P)-dependent dehydrogenase (short-subunit alcohol dehydrogenase family)